MPCLVILGLLGGLFLLLVTCNSEQPPTPMPTPTPSSSSREEAMATLINLNGHLCAKILLVTPELSNGERQVNCKEYRDPNMAWTKNNMVVYMVDLDRGTVRQMGRS